MVRPSFPALLFAGAMLGAAWGAACTGPLSIENRACPCSSDYICCEQANICLPKGQTCAAVYVTSSRLSVRQGDTLTIQLGGTDLVDLTQVMAGSIPVALPAVMPSNMVVHGVTLAVSIPHGTTPGPHVLSVTTRGGAKTYPAVATIDVSPIAVGAKGNDGGPGTIDNPFRTLEHAFAATAAGDTVQINKDVDVITSSVASDVMIIPDDITLQGELASTGAPAPQDQRPVTTLMGRVQIRRKATIRQLTLASRVEVLYSASTLTLENVQSLEGREVGATVDSQAKGSHITVTGPYSKLISTYASPLDIGADGVVLIIEKGASVINLSDDKEAVWLASQDASVVIDDATLSAGGPNVVMSFQRSFFTVRTSSFRGFLHFMGPEIDATVDHCSFYLSTGTSAIGGVVFDGHRLSISDSTFVQTELRSEAPDGEITIRRTTFGSYQVSPIKLMKGALDLGTMTEPGANTFQSGGFFGSDQRPVAIDVTAPEGKGSVSMSHTMVNGVMPSPHSTWGPETLAPFYRLANRVLINLF